MLTVRVNSRGAVFLPEVAEETVEIPLASDIRTFFSFFIFIFFSGGAEEEGDEEEEEELTGAFFNRLLRDC